MPESAGAARKRLSREAARRRGAVTVLQIAECTARYGASVLANGASPDEARAAAVEVAAELATIAETLRRLTRLGPSERRERAVQLAALGWETADRGAARRVGQDRAVLLPASVPGRAGQFHGG